VAWALERYARVETIGFDYRQRHRIELDARQTILSRLRREFPHWDARLGADQVIDLGVLAGIGDSALTREVAFEMGKNGLPNTFVPGRNLLFLTIAAAVAYRRSIEVLVGGMCETDFSGYPDCRDTTMKAMQAALTLGLDRRLAIETPLMWIDKAATWQMARELGGDKLIALLLDDTVTCYLSERGARHAWGHGCGSCPSCELRRRGHEKWRGSSAA
jgi:7-cyano-7-deazaguanine synthase